MKKISLEKGIKIDEKSNDNKLSLMTNECLNAKNSINKKKTK